MGGMVGHGRLTLGLGRLDGRFLALGRPHGDGGGFDGFLQHVDPHGHHADDAPHQKAQDQAHNDTDDRSFFHTFHPLFLSDITQACREETAAGLLGSNCLNYRESLEPRTLMILSFTRSFTY